jgi:hypothetical protein
MASSCWRALTQQGVVSAALTVLLPIWETRLAGYLQRLQAASSLARESACCFLDGLPSTHQLA